MRYLTKSRFKLAVDCPTKLFYTGKESVYRNLMSEDTFMQALADGGFQVGSMATMRYPGGIEVTERSNAEALARTQALLNAHEQVVLFEPAIAHGGLLVRVDVLVKQGNNIDLIEVKAKSYDSDEPNIVGKRGDITSGMLPYIQDIAFQRYVVSQAMPQATLRGFLLMPNKAQAAPVSGLNQCFKIRREGRSVQVIHSEEAAQKVAQSQALLSLVPVDEYIEAVLNAPLAYPGSQGGPQDLLPQAAARWAQAYARDEKIPPILHSGCAHCEFREGRVAGEVAGGYEGAAGAAPAALRSGYHDCLLEAAGLTRAQVDAGTVLDIWNFRGKDKLLAQGVVRMGQVTEEDLGGGQDDAQGLSHSGRRRLQVLGIPAEQDRGGFYFDADVFEQQRQSWYYPYHLIDFETCTVALPFFAGMRPYESVAFQFSHHVMHADGRIEHRSQALLAQPGVLPNFAFVRALREALGQDKGSIFRWAAHENTILVHVRRQLMSEELAQQGLVPADRDALVAFIDEITTGGPRDMIDLNKLALKAYFHPQTHGRTSIKKVLPAVMASSQFVQRKYEQPIYGEQIASLNFRQGFAWVERDATTGELLDPYQRLKGLAEQMLGENTAAQDVEIAEGGAAAMAYARLQFEDITPEERHSIEQALLRYCELDTFAMVMILEAWLAGGRPG